MFEVKVDTETIKHVMDACKTEKTLNQHGVVIYNCLKELLEYRETELTPDKIREMDKLYLEKCQEVNSLVAACEKLEGRKQYETNHCSRSFCRSAVRHGRTGVCRRYQDRDEHHRHHPDPADGAGQADV